MLWTFNWILLGWGTWLAYKHFHSTSFIENDQNLPPVSILKPLKGVDDGLEKNLESFFLLDYPNYEILFSVSNPEDPAVALVKDLQKKYPIVSTKLLCEPENLGPNPKVNNLVSAYQKAQYDTVLISDSNIRAKKDYLKNLVPDLKEKVGMITAVVSGSYPSSFGGVLEASYLNTFLARWMFLSKKFGYPSVVGKSMLFKKSILKRMGGIEVLGRYIAEDYMAGHGILKLGLQIEIMRQPLIQYIGRYSFSDFWKRHVRWGRIRKSIAPFAFLIEPLFSSGVSGFFGALASQSLFGWSPIVFFCLHMLLWSFLDLFLFSVLDRFYWNAFWGWWARELISLPLWVFILLGNQVHWRGKHYRLEAGGLLKGDLS